MPGVDAGSYDAREDGGANDAGDARTDAGTLPDAGATGDAANPPDGGDSGNGCGSNWRRDTVTTEPRSSRPHLAVGPKGELHVVFTVDQPVDASGPARRSIAHSVNTGTGWEQRIVAQNGAAWSDADIAVDSSGFAHLCYRAESGITYATHASGGWTQEIVYRDGEPDPSSGDPTSLYGGCSIALDPAGHPHIAFAFRYGFPIPADTDVVMYASKLSGTWTRKQPLGLWGEGYFEAVKLAAPGQGDVRVAASFHPGYFLDYFGPSGPSSFRPRPTETVEYFDFDLAVDPAGRSHVFADCVLYDAQPEDHTTAFHGVMENGVWTYEPFAKTWIHPSLAIDPAGDLHLSFWNNGLFYARRRGATWEQHGIDSSAGYDRSAIAVTRSGVPHVLYTAGDGSLTHAAGCAL